MCYTRREPVGVFRVGNGTLAVMVLYAVLSLTLIRVLPNYLALTGTGETPSSRLFLGWFGPRGLASILFTLIMMDEFDFPGEEELLACVSMTVFLSIILHGITAAPLSKRIGRPAQQDSPSTP